MSLFGRFLGRGRDKAYTEGLAHLENGDFQGAIGCLRLAALGKSDTPSGSLASFQFRQALLREGHRLLQSVDRAAAIPCFAEAVKLWDHYPDLHFLHGAAQGLGGADWAAALGEARVALRLNSDYVEARLLEARSLQALERPREVATSLTSLVESGRRVDHWLPRKLAADAPFQAAPVSADLAALLERCLGGQSDKDDVAAAVALCQAGRWDEGLARFAALVDRHPRYADYRTRHAAALFQTGRNEQALAEVEAALALNESYRAAINLKGLILAEAGSLRGANEFLCTADERLRGAPPASSHEALFGAYLRGVLALLCGRAEDVGPILGEWSDLGHHFARAELLLAAADSLLGNRTGCNRRLMALVDEWNAEPVYYFLLACGHLGSGDFHDMAEVLGRWPLATDGSADHRPLYLEGMLSVQQGRVPAPPPERETAAIAAEAWSLLRARADYIQGAYDACWTTCHDLVAAGYGTERVLRLQGRAAARAELGTVADWRGAPVVPDSCLPGTVYYAVKRDEGAGAADLVRAHRQVHPESLVGYWLDAAFWLDPVRTWIA